jgi:DUF4097 and DUF4098 domain-containing protein YvlB
LGKSFMLPRLTTLFVLIASPCWALSEENIEQQLDATPGGRLVVDVDFGNVDITVGNDTEVSVRVHRKIDSGNAAREKEYVAAVPILVSKEGNVITVRARRAKDRDSWSWSGNAKMEADYTVRVPKKFDAELRTSGGGITADGLTGEMNADTSGGKMKFTQLHGPLDARTSGGSIAIEGCVGTLAVATSGGAIDCKNGSGSLDARTSGGSIAVSDFGGDAEVKTSGGKLTFENVIGRLIGKTSAGAISARLTDPVPGDVTLQTSAGSIDVALPAKSAVNVDAKTGMGNIRTEIPMLATRSSDDRLQGTLNGGGKLLDLKASVGSITIRPSTEPTLAR